jgi:hypothetical protein
MMQPPTTPTKLKPDTMDCERDFLLSQLYQDAIKATNTDLEVRCPTGSVEATGLKSFNLHYCVASLCSDYFKTFPEPRTGRIIDEIEAHIFLICLQFMYCRAVELSHETVSSVLVAAELLALPGLTKMCFEYLQHNLDYTNHESVISIAE